MNIIKPVFLSLLLLQALPASAQASQPGHEMPPAGPQASAPTPAQQAAAFPELHMDMRGHMADSQAFWKLMVDQLEAQEGDAGTALAWEASAWWGGDRNRLWLGSEGERLQGQGETETEIFWAHSLARWWDSTLGVRLDQGHGPGRQWLTFGAQGLAPYFFESRATALVGEGGRTGLRLEAEYELLLTNRLILQPSLELNAYGRDDKAAGLGRGLADSELGLRLRYEIRREFAPYIGLSWARRYGRTADLARAAGEDVQGGRALAGLRLWF